MCNLEEIAMDEKTLAALRGSISKWEGIVAGTMQDSGASNCPLCKKFRKKGGRLLIVISCN